MTSLTASAQITYGKTSFKIVNENKIILTLEKGFHFNEKAPAGVFIDDQKKTKPSLLTREELMTNIQKNHKNVRFEYYVCDDQNTVCEKNELAVDLKTKKEIKIAVAETKPVKFKELELSKTKKNLLIFTAPWCPACMRMKNETYSDKQVDKIFKSLNVVSLNKDLNENFQVYQKYKVKYIPTLVLVDTNGHEINRWVGYFAVNKFSDQLNQELKSTNISELEKKNPAKMTPKEISKLTYYYYSLEDWDNTLKWADHSRLAFDKKLGMKAKLEKLIQNPNQLSEKELSNQKLNLLAHYKEDTELTAFDRLEWSVSYLEEQFSETEYNLALKRADSLLSLTNLKDEFKTQDDDFYSDMGRAKILDLKLKLARLKKDEKLILQTKKDLADEIKSIKFESHQPGAELTRAEYFEETGNFSEAEAVYKKLIEDDPNSYVYYWYYSQFLLSQKRPEEALKQIDLALERKEGNEPQLNVDKIKSLLALNKKPEAKELFNKTQGLIEGKELQYKKVMNKLNRIKSEF